MLKYQDFLNIAEYGNENWKGNYSPEEIRQNADNYFSDYQWSLKNEIVTGTITFLLFNLLQDWNDGNDNDNIVSWISQLINDLDIIKVNTLLTKFIKEMEHND